MPCRQLSQRFCREPGTTRCTFARSSCSGQTNRAAAEGRIVVSADTDFGTLLAARQVKKPSVVLFRGPGSRTPEALARALLSNLSQLSDALERGSLVTFEPSRVRVRTLPITTTPSD